MKKSTSLLVGFFGLIVLGYGQGNIHYFGWDTAYNYYPSDIVQTQNGGFLIIGDVNSSQPFIENFYFKHYLVHTDSNGDTLWTRYYGQEFYGGANVIQAPSGDFKALGHISGGYMCGLMGSSLPFTNYCVQTYLSTGDSVSTDTYKDTCENRITDFSKDPSGGMAALVRAENPILMNFDNICSIKEMGINGNINNISIAPNSPTQLEKASNGYWVTDYSQLYKVSLQGSTIWQDSLNLPATLKDFCKVNDDSLVFVCSWSGYDTVFVVKTDSFGNQAWTKKYLIHARDILKHSTGNYVITGEIGGDLAILVLNSNGDSLWSKTYQLTMGANGLKTIETNNELATLAYSGGFGMPGQYVLVLDTMTSYSSVANNILSDDDEFRLYPNPNTGKFNVEMSIPGTGSVELRLTNILGRQLYYDRTMPIHKYYKRQFNLSNYPAGVYTLQLITDQKLITRQVILE